MSDWRVGEYIIYRNSERYELGRIVSLREDGAFVCYNLKERLQPKLHMTVCTS